MPDYETAFQRLTSDPRYLRNLAWGASRPGHPEGTIGAHIAELEDNLEQLRPRLSADEYWKLKLAIHTHDTFKPDAQTRVPITDPRSHASLAREFLAAYFDDPDLLGIVQYHDEPYALWRRFQSKGAVNEARFAALLAQIKDWSLFLAFCLIDGCTAGKSREPLAWLFGQLQGRIASRFTATDML